MSTVRDFALPTPPAARDQKLVKPIAILAGILRSLHTRSERRRLDRAVPARPSCHPVLPTFSPSTWASSSARAAPGSATIAGSDEREREPAHRTKR